MRRRLSTLFFALLLVAEVSAQTDSLHTLPEVLIRRQQAERSGYSTWKADSLPVLNNLALSERLSWDNAVEVRPNAPGTLATLSIRGAGAKRSPVLWNGLPLQSPMNGTVDLALLPVWPGDQLEVRFGGQSAVQSAGSMGGSVLLQSQPFLQKDGFFGSATATAGSWGRFENAISGGYASERWASNVRASRQSAHNDFPYVNFTQLGKPVVRQSNNFLEKWDVEQHNFLKINNKNTLCSSYWYQRAFREIPPTMTQAVQTTWQRDRATRALLQWENRTSENSTVQTKVAWLEEAIFFNLYGKVDSSRARTVLLTGDYSRLAFGQQYLFKIGWNAQQQWARADGYTDSTAWYRQTRLAAVATAERRFQSGNISLAVRQEWAEEQGAPLTWSLGGQFALGPGLLRFHLSRNFNLPTFNDRFWLSYGRKDLRPEKGYSNDLGWKYGKRQFSAEVFVFQVIMDDWIDWQPGADGIFRPYNLKKVWSRGVSLQAGKMLKTGKWSGHFSGRYQYLKATNNSVYAGEESILGKQLAYTPQHSGGVSAQVRRGGFSAAYLHQFTGSRFVTSDNLTTIEGFQTGNLFLQYVFPKKPAGLSVGFRLENIWNTAYQVLQYRPMPGRGWKLEISYNW